MVSDYPFELNYCRDKYKTQEMCNKSVDDFIPALKFVLDWFVTSKMKRLLTALYAYDNILYFNEDSGGVVFSCNKMGILGIDPNWSWWY